MPWTDKAAKFQRRDLAEQTLKSEMLSIRLLIPGAVMAVGLAFGAAGYALSGDDIDPHESPTGQFIQRTGDEGVRRDGEAYAQAVGVSADEGARRIQAQLDNGPIVSQVRAAAGEREAAIWLEHSPEFKMVASFTGERDELIAQIEAITAGSPVPFEIRLGAPHSKADLTRAMEAAVLTVPGIDSWGVAEVEGVVELNLAPYSTDDPKAVAAEFSERFGVPFNVTIVESPARNGSTYGGTLWDDLDTYNANCTTGFTVQNGGGATGVLTAGHCGPALANPTKAAYYNLGNGPYTTQLNSRYYGAAALSHDVQWSSVAGTEYPNFWDGSAYQLVTGTTPRSSLTVGTAICMYGAVTGFTCGLVQSVGHNPGNLCPDGINYSTGSTATACAATYPRADRSAPFTLTCQGGDSGGPVFIGGSAVGLFKAYNGTYSSCWFMSIDYIANMGVTVMQ